MRVLAIALSGIGDALMFTPALTLLKKNNPDYSIDVLVMYGGAADIFSRMKEVNRVIKFNFLKEKKIDSFKFVLGLRSNYDASINVYPSNRLEYNIISFLIGTDIRLGVSYKLLDNINLGFLNNKRIEEDLQLHNVEENVKLIKLLSGSNNDDIPPLIFNLKSEDIDFAENYFKTNLIEEVNFIGFHAGCSTLKNHINRRWAPEKFSELAKRIRKELNLNVLIFGGPDEQELKSFISENSGAISVNTPDLAKTAAIMKWAKAFITNDSALMHVAASMKLKTLPIIGPTNINFIYPWKTEYIQANLELECSPCFFYSPKPLSCSRKDLKYKCVKDISVDFVYNKLLKLLSK